MTHPQNPLPDPAQPGQAPQQPQAAYTPQAPQYVPHQPGQPDPGLYGQQPVYTGGAPGGPGAAPQRSNGLAIAALVVGILSLIFCWVPVAGAIGGVVAVVLGILGMKKARSEVGGKGLALGGLITGALAFLIGAAVTVITFIAIGQAGAALEELEQEQQDAQEALDQAIEDAEEELAQGAEEPVAEEPVEVVEEGVSEGDAGRLDFSHVTCDLIAEEAIAISVANADVTTPLTAVTETVLVADYRADYPVPAGTEEAVVMSCGGNAAFTDGTAAFILMDLSVDGEGTSYVFYTTE